VLALASSSPAFAQKKKAGPAAADSEPANDTASTNTDPESGVETKGNKPGKGKKKIKAGSPGSKPDPASAGSDSPDKGQPGKKGRKGKAAESATATEPMDEPIESDLWERPPADAEKPAPPLRKVEKRVVGDGRPISVGLVVGWAFLTDRKVDRFGADPYGLALGVRGGYSFDFQLYAGLFYSYYLGETRSGQTARTGLMATSTAHYMQFGIEAGYDVWAGPVVMRPSMQIGAVLGFTTKQNTQSPLGAVLLAPGVTVIKPWGGFFLGGDMRLNIVAGDGNSAFVVAINGGLRFE
jgi:hypothetical protein